MPIVQRSGCQDTVCDGMIWYRPMLCKTEATRTRMGGVHLFFRIDQPDTNETSDAGSILYCITWQVRVRRVTVLICGYNQWRSYRNSL